MSVPCHGQQDVRTLYDKYMDYGEDFRFHHDEFSPHVQSVYRRAQSENVAKQSTSLTNRLLQIMGMIVVISCSETCRRKRITDRLRDCEFQKASKSWRNDGRSTVSDEWGITRFVNCNRVTCKINSCRKIFRRSDYMNSLGRSVTYPRAVPTGPGQSHNSSESNSGSDDSGGDTNIGHRKRDREDDEPNRNDKKRDKEEHTKKAEVDNSESGRCQCMDAAMHIFRCFGRRPIDAAQPGGTCPNYVRSARGE